ncbi:MAG: hypothetical protein GH155_05270 [Spirochaeta sp.]|nr:hypothetical protein [Spirochaeta sp.]
MDDSDSDYVTASITGPIVLSEIEFKMAKDGFDWMIEEAFLDNNKVVD